MGGGGGLIRESIIYVIKVVDAKESFVSGPQRLQ